MTTTTALVIATATATMTGFPSVRIVLAAPLTFDTPEQISNDTTTTTSALGQNNTSSGEITVVLSGEVATTTTATVIRRVIGLLCTAANNSAVASNARINLLLVADIDELTANPDIDQIVTYNKTFDVNASDFEQFKAHSISTTDAIPRYRWSPNASEIGAPMPEPKTSVKFWPPSPDVRPWDHWILTVTLPDGKIITSERNIQW